VLSLFVLAPLIEGQVTTATIYGVVLDPSGAAIPEASVTAISELTSTSMTAVTNDRGEFTIPFLPVGAYTITVDAKGFRPQRQTGMELAAGQKANLSYTMQLGATTEAVTVTSAAPILNLSSAQQDVMLNSRQAIELPMARRDISNMLNLGTGTSAGGDTISINGLPTRGFSFTVDGVDASPDSEFPSLALYGNINYIKGVSIEAVREVQIAKNIFSAEIANTVSGNVNIISKSGTNDFHGSLFENYQAGGLSANNHLLAAKSSLVFHQFGGSLGGRIVPDKVFFFGTFEGYRLNQQQPLTGNVPSRWARDQIIARIPEAQTYFDLWPLPTEGEQAGDVVASFAGTDAAKRTDNHALVRVDYNISSKDFLNARYSRGRPNTREPRLITGNARVFEGENENGGASYTHVFNPAFTSEFRVGHNYSYVNRLDEIYTAGIPVLQGAGLPTSGGEIFIKYGSTTTFENSNSWVRGAHSLKFGGLLRWQRASRENIEVPIYTFSTFNDILENRPSNGRYVFDLSDFRISRWFAGAFLQDDYRVTPSLMLNLGIRYDYSSVPTERDGRFFNRDGPFGPYRDPDQVWNAYYGMVSPRVGLAWTLDQSRKTVFRGGFGIFFIPHNLFSGPVELVKEAANIPFDTELSLQEMRQGGIRYPDPNATVLPIIIARGIVTDSAIDPNWQNSYSMQWTAGIQRQITESMALDVAYVANRGVKMVYSPDWNRVDRITGLRPYPNFSQFRYYQSADSSIYNSLQASLRKRFSRNLMFNINYTWASNLAYYIGDYNCCGADNGPQDLNDLSENRAPTPYHIRHRFISDVIYELPLARFSGDSWAKRWLFEGWQAGGIFLAETGPSLDIRQNIGAAAPGARPDYVGPSHEAAIRPDYAVSENGSYQYLDASMFANVPISPVSGATIRAGNLGRRSIYGPGQWTIDLALSKNLKLGEGQRIQLRADLFNALNHTNFRGVDTNSRSSRFGRITSTGPGRVTQLSARFDF
jgi:hypothetical protein